MRDNGQAIMAGSDSNENVKVAYSQALFGEALTDFSVITYPISKWQYRKCRFYLFRLLQMLFYSGTMKRSISEFGKAYFRCKNLLSRCFCNMLIYTTTMSEKFNPSIRVKNKPFHKFLIIKVDFTVKRTTIITMLHHLIVLFSFFCFRPNTCQFKKFSLTFFCRKCCCLFFGHNQFVGQPLTIVFRERKSLQICPQIVQCRCCHKPMIFDFSAKI